MHFLVEKKLLMNDSHKKNWYAFMETVVLMKNE